jgi:HPr serine kinase-like protein
MTAGAAPNERPSRSNGGRRYRAFGLVFTCPFACPELTPGEGTPDVVIRFGEVPHTLGAARRRGVRFEANPEEFLLVVDDVARYLVRGGAEVVIDPAGAASEDSLRLFLLGSVMGALLQQRGVLPLHASAVDVDGGCVAFLGPSGTGKSTVAAALVNEGYRLVADDICAVTSVPGAAPVVHPGYPQIKIWGDMARTLHLPVETFPRIQPDKGRYALRAPEAFDPGALPLSRIYVLAPANSDMLRIEEVSGATKLALLRTHTFRDRFIDGLASREPQFRVSADIAMHVPMGVVTRPAYPVRLSEMIRILERHWARGA